jgi:diguanylate cyclase (GGDEF)-like protein
MVPKLKERLTNPGSSIPILVTAAVVCLLFLVLAGTMVYVNTRRTITATDWIEHTQEVINSLRAASQVNERIEANFHLFLVTGDATLLDKAQGNVKNLEASVAHLKVLVFDNANQEPSIERLTECSAELSLAIKGMQTTPVQPKAASERCQLTINSMLDMERRLLLERSQTSHRIEIQSLTTDFVFIGLSLLALSSLFGFLLRGEELRRRTDGRIIQTNRDLERSVELLRDQAQESDLLTRSRDELQLCVSLLEVYRSAQGSFARLLPGSGGALAMTTNSRNMMETVASWGEMSMEDCHPPDSCCGLRSGQPRWREDGFSEIHCSHFSGSEPDNYACFPVIAHGDTLGLLYIQCPDAACMDGIRGRMDGLRQLIQLTGMAVASMKLRIKLENQSIRDPLTGLFNRHFMEVALDRELARAARRKTMLAVFMLDIDHFKNFNDIHGHSAGDSVLRAVAEVCRNTIRPEDTACRYGGEELTIILPEMTEELAYSRAENIRRAISELRVQEGKQFYGEVTISIGVALYPDDGVSAEALLRSADQALYRAKRQGRNQVSVAEAIFAS